MFDNNLLTPMNLKENIGLSSYNGMAAQQNHKAFSVFYDFLSSHKPERILEIGTALGGFTDFLFMSTRELNLKTKIHSYDINYNNWYDDLQKKGISIFVKNIFDHSYTSLVENDIVSFIKQPGLTVILCDGGCKKCEYNILSRYLKSNDIIMTHDYAPNKEHFETHMNGKIWNWHEIEDSDIIQSMREQNIEKYMYEEFLSVAWLCSKKL